MNVETRGRYWARPVFRVGNVAESIAYYCEKLGFEKEWDEGGDDSSVAQVCRGGFSLMLDKRADFPKASIPSVISLTLPDSPSRPGLDALHRELVAKGARISKAPFKVHWDKTVYEMDVEDIDGNVLMFWGNMPSAK